MTRPRRIALVLGLVCLAVFALSVWSLFARIQAFNEGSGRTMYTFKLVGERGLQFAGRPVSLMDEEKEGQTVVVVRYGDRELRLLAAVEPGNAALPGLVRHADWLRVLRFAEYKGAGQQEHLDAGNDRLAIVTRRPLTAPDPRTGQVWAKDWLFDFHEFKPDGTIVSESLRYPKTKGDRNPKPGELRPNTWEMDAAMGMMPGSPPDSLNFGRPSAPFKEDALRAAGWTMPAAVASALGLVACLVVLVGPRRTLSGG